ncbi:MAG: hypothetical protein J5879_02405 [Clostridia bacterium]|nr:hypothetical protein [Clostridia bacterium]
MLRRLLSLTVLFSAVAVPVLNEGLLLTFVEAIDGNVAWWIGIPIALRYVSVILTYACTFVSYAAVIAGILHYGYANFKTPPILLFCGSLCRYIIAGFGSWVFCYEHQLIDYTAADVGAMGFQYLFRAIFDLIKNVVLVVIFCRISKKIREGKTDQTLPDETYGKPDGFGAFIRSAFSRKHPYGRVCGFAAGVEAVYCIASVFLFDTVFALIANFTEGETIDYAEQASRYALIIPFCLFGFFGCVLLCRYFSSKKPKTY